MQWVERSRRRSRRFCTPRTILFRAISAVGLTDARFVSGAVAFFGGKAMEFNLTLCHPSPKKLIHLVANRSGCVSLNARIIGRSSKIRRLRFLLLYRPTLSACQACTVLSTSSSTVLIDQKERERERERFYPRAIVKRVATEGFSYSRTRFSV